MKFFKKIMILIMLLVLQNSFLFGLETPELEQISEMEQIEKMRVAKDKAIKVLNAYINIPSTNRVQRNIELAERALQAITSYEMSGGSLTVNEKVLISRVMGALPIDKSRLAGRRGLRPAGRRRAARATGKRVVQPTRARAARVTTARPTRRPIRYGAQIPTKREVRRLQRTGQTRGITPAPVIIPASESIQKFKNNVAHFFGGNLQHFFWGPNLNRAEFSHVLQVLERDRQKTTISRGNAYKLIIETINNNKNSEITPEQEQILKNFLSAAPILKETSLLTSPETQISELPAKRQTVQPSFIEKEPAVTEEEFLKITSADERLNIIINKEILGADIAQKASDICNANYDVAPALRHVNLCENLKRNLVKPEFTVDPRASKNVQPLTGPTIEEIKVMINRLYKNLQTYKKNGWAQ